MEMLFSNVFVQFRGVVYIVKTKKKRDILTKSNRLNVGVKHIDKNKNIEA